MAQNRELTEHRNSDQPLERDVLWRANMLSALIGIMVAVQFGASLLKRSRVGFAILILTGADIGYFLGTLAITLTRGHLRLYRLIMVIGDWIIGILGILGLVIAIYQLFISISRHEPNILFSSSFCGSGAMLLMNLTGFLTAGYGLLGVAVFAILLVFTGLEIKNLLFLMFSAFWTACIGYALLARLRRASRNAASQPLPTDLDP